MIVDDEELARGFLREMLAAHPEIEIVAECANGFEAVKAIAETAAGPGVSGRPDAQAGWLRGAGADRAAQRPAVIFVTAYDQYAMRAFDAHAVDYLLKPFSAERFERALERAKARLGERTAARAGSERARRAPGASWSGRHARARDPARKTGLRGGAGRLRGAAQRRQELPEAAAHRQPGSRCSTRRGSCAYTAPRSSTWSAWRASSRTRKESRVAILADGTRLPVSRSGYARLLEAMGDSQGSRNTTR